MGDDLLDTIDALDALDPHNLSQEQRDALTDAAWRLLEKIQKEEMTDVV